MKKRQILNELLLILTEHLKIHVDFGEDYEKDRRLFRGLCNQSLQLNGIGDRFYELQDELLSIERKEKVDVKLDNLEFKDNIAFWQGDITRLEVDAIVNAANDHYLGCFVPCHNCIDNCIMSCSGFQLRNELFKLKSSEDYSEQKVKVTGAYNLPCKYIFHIAGPIVFGAVSDEVRQKLQDCYLACLERAKEMGLTSLAFCCISTGEFRFPNDEACEIAVDTTKKWLACNDSKLKVIFNVFKDIDRELYERKLSRKN